VTRPYGEIRFTYSVYKSRIYLLQSLRTTHFCPRRSFDDVTLNNVRFRFLSRDLLRMYVVHPFAPNLVEISSSISEILAIYEIQDGRPFPFPLCWGAVGPAHTIGQFMVEISCIYFIIIGSVVFKL